KRSAASITPAFGEEALWHYKRGAAFVGLRQLTAAATDLRLSLSKEGRRWVHARAHTELGKIADATGDRGAARAEYQLAVNMARDAKDSSGVAEAERLLDEPYRPE